MTPQDIQTIMFVAIPIGGIALLIGLLVALIVTVSRRTNLSAKRRIGRD